jgi:hypothetical protein
MKRTWEKSIQLVRVRWCQRGKCCNFVDGCIYLANTICPLQSWVLFFEFAMDNPTSGQSPSPVWCFPAELTGSE